MAYLDPQALACPGCGARAEISWVIGEGPNTRPGEGPAYIGALPAPAWRIEEIGAGVRVYCANCGSLAAERTITGAA